MGNAEQGEVELSSPRALLIEDSPESVVLVTAVLEHEGFEVVAAPTGIRGVDFARSNPVELVVLDIGLPDLDGFYVCRQLRMFTDAYIIMLTARESETDKVVGLEVGADDYITKPFSPRELAARVKAIRRRPRSAVPEGQRELGSLIVDLAAREVTLDGQLVDLTKIEYDLLELLTSAPGLTFTRKQVLDKVWGDDWFGDDHVIDVHMGNLRRKIGDNERADKLIRTVRGVGYRFVAPVQA
jgi:DNA-binding response OmpR family regulator